MKKALIWTLILLLLATGAAMAAGITLDQSGTVRLPLGDSLTVHVTSIPSGETARFSSTYSSVARVDEHGTVTALKEGTTTIKAVTNKGKSASFTLKVFDPSKPTGIVMGQTGTAVVYIGTPLKLTHTVTPATADGSVKYASSNKNVASVDESGLVTGHKEGTVTVSVTSKKVTSVRAAVKIKVVDPAKPTKMTLGQTGTVLVILNTNLQITHTMTPATADTAVKYASSNKNVASVDENGLVTARKEGTVTITVTSRKNGNVKATVKVKVVDPAKPTKMTLGQTGTVTVNVDTNLQITHTMAPDTADKAVKYTSSNKNVATVDENGLLTAHKEGTVTITVTSKKLSSVKASFKVKVVDPYKPTKLIPDQTGTTVVYIGTPLQITHTAAPATADKTCKYATSNKAVAAVDETGLVTAQKEGTATITLTSRRNANVKANVKIKVVDPLKPTKMALGQTGTVTVVFGETLQLTHTMTPATADTSVKYASGVKTVASVSDTGLVTALKEGTSIITVTSRRNSSVKATVKVRVIDPYKPDKMTLDKTGTVDLFLGSRLTLTASVTPATADGSAKFTSSAPSVATVDESGTVTPVKEGTVTITAISKKVSSVKATVKVRVLDPTKPASISLSATGEVKMDLDTTLPLTYTLSPATAVSDVTFSSQNSKVARVSQDGTVAAVGEGSAVITAKTKVSGRTATVKIKVVDPKKPTSVKIEGERAYTIGTFDAFELSVTLQPATAAEAKVTWKSSNKSVATVTSSGKVTGMSAGTAYITASSAGKSDKIKVTVKKGGMPTGVSIAGALSYSVKVGDTRTLSASFVPDTAFGGLTWDSTNPAVAAVDQNGRVTAIRPGMASIIARSDRNGVTGQVRFTVTSDDPSVKNELPLSGVIIGIDPGHQLKGDTSKEPIAPGSSTMKVKVTDGTRGTWTRATEFNVNLQVALKLRDRLTALGAEVYMTRTTNYINISNIQRARMMNDAGCGLVLRLHCNGSDNPYDSGIYVYSPGSGSSVSGPSNQAAQAILAAMKQATGVSRGAVHATSTYTGLNWSTVPSVLIEMGYMSNYTEDYRLSDPAYQGKLADGMVNGIKAFFGR